MGRFLGVDILSLHPEVQKADELVKAAEARDLLEVPPDEVERVLGVSPADVARIRPWDIDDAATVFRQKLSLFMR